MEIPLKVRLIWPAMKAWLLPASFQDSVPSISVFCSSVAYFSAAMVSLESSAILLFSSTR
jgi:hypothetical protein